MINTRDCYCILCIIVLMVGIKFRKEVRFQMVNRVCGAIIMHVKLHCILKELSTRKHTILFSTFNESAAKRYFEVVYTHDNYEAMEHRRSRQKFFCGKCKRNNSLA